MRICFLTTSYPRFPGDAAGQFVHALAVALVHRGHEVIVVAPHTAQAALREHRDGVRIFRVPYWWSASGQMLAYGYGILGNLRSRWWGAVQIPGLFLSLRRAVARQAAGFDIIHAHWLTSALAVPPGLPSRHVVITAHGSDVSLLTRPWLLQITRPALRRADAIIAVSQRLRERVLNLGLDPNRVTVIPDGLPNAAALLSISPKLGGGMNFLTVGRLVRVKNHAGLIQAFQRVIAEYPGATLTVVGDGPERAALVAMVKNAGIDDHVSWLGSLRPEDLVKEYERADVVISNAREEGFGLSVLEGMASSRAVIATRVGAAPELIADGHNGLLIPLEDVSALATACLRLLRDKHLMASFGRTARQSVEQRYSWDAVAAETEKLYERIS